MNGIQPYEAAAAAYDIDDEDIDAEIVHDLTGIDVASVSGFPRALSSPDEKKKKDAGAGLAPDGSLLLTHRRTVYLVPQQTAEQLLASCEAFSELPEAQRMRLTRALTGSPVPGSLRFLRRHRRLLNQLTPQLRAVDQLATCCDGDADCVAGLRDLLEREPLLAPVARRHLRRIGIRDPNHRLDGDSSSSSSSRPAMDGNSRPFPLLSENEQEAQIEVHVLENLRRDVHNDSRRMNTDFGHSEDHSFSTQAQPLVPMTPSELYRPYLNSWTPMDVTPLSPSDASAGCCYNELCQQHPPDAAAAVAAVQWGRQRLLATVIVGGLTWRQKQHRQQQLAVRLATRSALIGLKHSISVQPEKNYLELYVNMISRAVGHTSAHVRKWSHCLEHSWRAFKDLAGAPS